MARTFHDGSIVGGAPRQATMAGTISQMITNRRQQEEQRMAQAAMISLAQARESGVTSEQATRARMLSTTAFGPRAPSIFNTDTLDSIQAAMDTRRQQGFLESATRTAQFLAQPENAMMAQDDVETIGRFESLGNALPRRIDAIYDGLWREANLLIDQTRRETARDAQLTLGEILADERAARAEEESGRPIFEGTDRRGRPTGEQIGETVFTGDDLPRRAGLSADAAGFFRWMNSRPAAFFTSQQRQEGEEAAATQSILDTLEINAREAAERAQIWQTGTARREIEATLGELENTPQGAIAGFGQLMSERPLDMMFYMAEISAESGVSILTSIAVGALTRSPGAVAATAGVTSGATSQALYFDELVQERGYDITTPEGRRTFLEDPRVLAEMQSDTFRYAAVVGLFDAASGGLASRTMVGNPVGELFLQTFAQGALGGTGEALGRIASGEEVNWTEVLLEALAEGVTAPIEVGGLAVSGVRTRMANAAQARQRRAFFDVIAGLVDQSTLRENDAAALQQAFQAVAEDGPMENIYVDPARMDELFQSGQIDQDAFFEAVPEIDVRDFREALDTGTDFIIPTSAYGAHIASTDIDALLAPHMRFRAEDMSEVEAQEFQQQLAEATVNIESQVDSVQTAIGELQGEIAGEFERLRSEISAAQPSLTPAAADKIASVMVQTARVQAQRSGIEIGEYLNRYMLPTVQNRDTVGPAPERPMVSPETVMRAMQLEDPGSTGVPQFSIIRDELVNAGIDPATATREQVTKAVRSLEKEGALDIGIEDMVAGAVDTNKNGEEMMQTATLRNGEEDASAWGIDTSKTNKVRDIALALQARQRKLYGKTRKDQRGPKTIKKFAEWMADEVEFELQTPDAAATGWYGPKFQNALDIMGQVVPALVDERAARRSKMPGVETVEDARALATAIFAVSSNGTNVIMNVDNATRILMNLDKTGETGGTQKHQRATAVNANTELMVRLAGEMGAANMQFELALTSGVVSELNQEVNGLEGATKINGYGADMVVPRAAMYLGPKLAAFYANLSGADGYLTMDLWWTRTIRRYQGDVLPGVRGLKNEVDSKGRPVGLHRFKHLAGRPDMTDAQALNLATEYAEAYARKGWKNGTEAEKAANTIHKDANLMLDEQPNGVADRKFMVEIARETQRVLLERTGGFYSIADIQALIWYYEKRLMVDMGARDSLSISYEEAAQIVAKKLSPQNEFNQGPAQPDMFLPEDQTPVSIDDFDLKTLRNMTDDERAALFKRPGWFIVSATDTAIGPWDHEQNIARAEQLRQELTDAGQPFLELEGVYAGQPDGPSFLIIGSEFNGVSIAQNYHQESILTNEGIVYTDGTGRDNVPWETMVYGHSAKHNDFYSQIKGGLPVDAFSMNLQFPSSEDVAYTDGDGTSHYGARLAKNGMLEMVHFSREERDVLDPAAAGTGQLPGPERKRDGPKKVYFGINQMLPSGYRRENSKLGGWKHTVQVHPSKMYSWNQDPDGLKAQIPAGLSETRQMGAYEDLIKAAGYQGYFVIGGPLGDAAVMFDAVTPVNVEYVNDAALRRSDNFRTWFRDSAIVNEDGTPRMVFHWTRRPGFTGFRQWSHFGTRKAAEDRAGAFWNMSDGPDGRLGHEGSQYIPAYLSMNNPLHVGMEERPDGDAWRNTADMLQQVGTSLPTPLMRRKWRRIFQETDIAFISHGDGTVYTDRSEIPDWDDYTVFTLEQLYRDFEHGFLDNPNTVDDVVMVLETYGNELANILTDNGYDGIAYTNTVEDQGSDSYVILNPGDVKSPWNEGAWDLNNADLLYQSGWHGSPHTFDRFTLNAIGTGEGAQAFGWGLYFAERRGIAEYYRDALAQRQPGLSFDRNALLDNPGTGRPPSPVFAKSDVPFRSAELLKAMMAAYPDRMVWDDTMPTWDGDTLNPLALRLTMEYAFIAGEMPEADEVQAMLLDEMRDMGGLQDGPIPQEVLERTFEQGETVLAFLDESGMEINAYRPGRLYEVHLPEDDELLIWDKPMRAQSPQVIAAAQEIMNDAAAAQGSKEALQIGPDELADHDIDILVREFTGMKDQLNERIDDMEASGVEVPPHMYSGLSKVELALVRVTSETPGLYMDLYEDVATALPFETQITDTILGIVQEGDMRTGEQFYYDLSALLGGDKEASETLRHYGIPGHKFPDRSSRGAPSDSRTYNFVIYDDTRIDVANMSQQNRGSIILPKQEGAQAIINIFETADLSTLLHETGHYQLWTLQKMARDGVQYAIDQLDEVANWWMRNSAKIAAEAKVDVAQVEEYLTVGTTGFGDVDGAIHVALHEQFARGFEAYLFEGKSPSHTMRSLFESIAAWMTSIYKRLSGLNVDMDPGIRAVFDKMLATEEDLLTGEQLAKLDQEIAEVAREMGIDEEAYRRLVQLTEEARDEGRQKARADALAAEKRIRSHQYQSRLAEIDAEERQRISAEPVHRAIQWLAYGRWLGDNQPEDIPMELRFDTALLQEDYPDIDINDLPRGRRPVHKKDTGLSADEVAGWFGFDSGHALLLAMQKAPKMNDAIETAVRQRAEQELGDIRGDEEARAESVADALHGEKHGQLIVGELRAINRLGGRSKKMTSRAQAKAIATEIIARMPVREAIQSNRYQVAERKHAEEAARLLATGDVDAAFEAKRKQLIQHALYVESRAAREMMAKTERLAGRLKRKGTRENLAPEYLGAIDDILETYDFRKISGKQEVRRARLQAYIDMMIREDRENELSIPDELMRETRRIPYKRLSTRRLRGVLEALQNIEHTARFKQKLRIAQQERELEDIRADVKAAFETNVVGKPINRVQTSWDKRKDGVRSYFNLIKNADTLLRHIDGWTNGRIYELFKADIDQAANTAQTMRQQATEDMEALFDRFYNVGERQRMDRRQLWDGYDQSLSKWDIISIALNMGNKDNLNRLLSVDSDGAFTRSQIDALVSNLDKKDWDFVQATWDYLNQTWWPQIAAREERVTGVRPTGVEPLEVETPFGTYRGGYYPIVYDGRYSGMVAAEQQEVLMKDMMAGKYGKAQTRNGHTKERAKGSGGRTVQLGMNVFFAHVNNVIHDLAYSEAVTNTWKLLQDPAIRGEFERAGMLPDHQALEWWIQDVAAGPGAGTHVMAGLFRHLKSGFTLSKLAFNMSTVAIQITGVTQSMALIGSRDMMRGYWHYVTANNGNLLRTGNQVKERSQFMEERQTTFQRDMMDWLRDMEGNPVMNKYSAFRRKLVQYGFLAMQWVQYYTVDVPTWIAAYEQATAKGMTDAEAGVEADRMVARAQASGLYADRTAIERGTIGQTQRQNEFIRLFTALGSYMFAKYNVAVEIGGRTANAIRDPDQSSTTAVAQAAFDFVLLFTIEAILYNLVKGTLPGWSDEDEDEQESWVAFLAKETALSMLSTLPFGRDVGSALQGFGGGGAYGGVSETIGRMGADIRDLTDGDDEWSAKDFRSFVDGLGLVVPGVPSTAIWRAYEGLGGTGEEVSIPAAILGNR